MASCDRESVYKHKLRWECVLLVDNVRLFIVLFYFKNRTKTEDAKIEAEIHNAHQKSICAVAWHPLGHLVVTGSSDKTIKFWARNRPGDNMTDMYNVNQIENESTRIEALMDVRRAGFFVGCVTRCHLEQ